MKRFVYLLLVIILGVGGFLGYQRYQAVQAARGTNWQTARAERGQLTATVGATGTVRANQTTILTWQTTGIVDQLSVEVGQTVQKGDILANLIETSLSQNIILAKAELVEAKRNLANLLDSDTTRAQAEVNLVRAQKAYDDAVRKRNNLNYRRANDATLDTARADYLLAQNEVDRVQEQFDMLAHRDENDTQRALALSALSAAKRKRDQAQANLNWYQGSSTEQEIAEADSNLALATANLADAEREWERLKEGTDPDDIAAAEARVAAIEATLQLRSIKAPFEATVTEILVKSGDQVSPGTVAFRLDDLSHLLVDVPVSEVDINRINVNQKVMLSFDAVVDSEYEGVVTQVARVGAVEQGLVNFNVTVEILHPDENVRAGMTTAVNVVVSQLNEVLLVPNRAVRLQENQRIVYILEEGVPQAVNIVLGASSETMSEVVSGDLREGDAVILNPSTEFQSNGRPPFMGNR